MLEHLKQLAAHLVAIEPRLALVQDEHDINAQDILTFNKEPLGHSLQYYDELDIYSRLDEVVEAVLVDIVLPLETRSSSACKAALDFMTQKGAIYGSNKRLCAETQKRINAPVL